MKKLLAGILAIGMATTLTACNNEGGTGGEGGGDGSKRVALIAKANSAEYWIKVKEGAEKAGEELGVEVTFNGPDTENEGDRQINMLESAIQDKPLGVGFAPQDGAQDSAPRIIDQAIDDDLPVVIFDTPLTGSDKPQATVASDNEKMGAMAAEEMVKLAGDSGKVAIIAHGEVGTAAMRRDGFKKWMEENAPNIQIVDVQNGQSDPALSRNKAQGIMQAHPDLIGFYGTDDDSVIAIADEVEAKGSETKVVGVDASPDVLTLLEGGQIAGIVTQDPAGMGYQTVKTIVEISEGKTPEKEITSEAVWVTAENINDPEIQEIIN